MSQLGSPSFGALRAALAAAAALLAAAAPASAALEDFGLETVTAQLSSDQAGAHADFGNAIGLKQDPASEPNAFGLRFSFATTRDVTVELPPGLAGNPEVVEKCTAEQLEGLDSFDVGGGCPNASQVGVIHILAYELHDDFLEPVYMMEPPGGDVVARLGFIAGIYPNYIDIRLDPARDYALTASAKNAPTLVKLVRAETTIWGVPADPVHDTERQTPREAFLDGASSSPPRPPGGPPLAFMTNPGRCATRGVLSASVTAWERADLGSSLSTLFPELTGCERLEFSPGIAFTPTSRRADAPAGMDVELSLPQDSITDPDAVAHAHLKKTVVTLPEGLAMNPAAADGLGACSSAQIGLVSKDPLRFDAAPAGCPDASKVGTAKITTPVLPDPIEGALYLADPNDNPFDTLLSGYLVAEGQGVLVKIAGRFDPDPVTGRIVATFDGNPQLPFSVADLHFKGGERGVISTPPTCGSFGVHSVFTSWASSREVPADQSLVFDQGCGGLPFEFDFRAGAAEPVAGASSAFNTIVSRADGTQRVKGLNLVLPPGLLATIKGVPQCPQAQAAAGTCDQASQIGTVAAASGAGKTPAWIPQPGKNRPKVFLAGPYKGAPFSLSVVVPAEAGPFDLGDVVVRVALFVDPTDGHVTAVSDPLPHILQGILLNVREMRVAVDRPGFTRNPTNCTPMAVGGVLTSLAGETKSASSRFQVGDCARLPFKPRFKLRLTGPSQTRDGGHPGLVATARQKPGQAGIRQVKVALPLSLALDPNNAQALCEYEDGLNLNCPASSIIGRAEAVTPLLNEPLTGPVYFVKNVRISPRTGRRIRTLPTLLVTLTGENGLKINLRATSDVDDQARLVSTFSNLPDAPVSSFKMSLQGGKDGILVVTHRKNVCRGKHIALAETDGHNGKHHDPKIRLATPCVRAGKPRLRGRTLRLPVRVPQAGTLRAGGGKSGLTKTTRRLARPGKTTLTLKPTRKARRTLGAWVGNRP